MQNNDCEVVYKDIVRASQARSPNDSISLSLSHGYAERSIFNSV